MIESLKHEDLIDKVGGRFKFTALVQKRWREILLGARPMVEQGKMTPLELVIREIELGLIDFRDPETSENE
jgi:DNA-directed RNA polymerase subunit omega